ncbi:Hsp70 family protein [Roseateles amylovorans]|uniref:Hsp70 family protein n=1 Tax=Roseateles amylovorans TaxID=2978473 RepID=A0ABY6ATV4_9BURK|nr:Hsp70 family protein [Roseateles amylovorans]UXH76649.1 Hsp70 family protein [Roseateles amylovorans]
MSDSPFIPDIVGIDLGTTNSLVACWQEGAPRLIPNALGATLTPSVVSVDDDGSYLVGAAAKDRLQSHPEHTVASFKRGMGTASTFRLGGRSFRAEELSALVLKSLRADVRAAFGRDVDRAVITVPAYFSDAQRSATRNAGLIAGFTEVSLLNEPTAAALAYGLNERDDSQFLVFDFGGGTFDVSILELFAGVMEVRATAGDNQLGGDDVDACLERWVMESARLPASLQRDERFLSKLRARCEAAKRALSAGGSTVIAFQHEGHAVDLRLSVEQLEQIIQPVLERLRHPVETAIRDARIGVKDLSAVVLAGGSSRLMPVRQLVTRLFGQFPSASLNPDEVVALGAAVQAGLKVNAAELSERVMTDVCPYTLGIESSQQLSADRLSHGFMAPILPRNTVIPASRVQSFSPLHPEQRLIHVRVYQGEARMVRDNIALGDFKVELPRPVAGRSPHIDVRFTYDVDGLLEVEATPKLGEDACGEPQRLVIQNSEERLSPEQVRERLLALAELKMHPRERMEVRALLARAERLFTQLSLDERDRLGHAITRFELELESQDHSRIDAASEHLRRVIRDCEADSPLGI